MRPMAMLVMIESITSKIKFNQKHGRATWVYVDEIHELWGEAHSLNSIERMWREVRKRGGICTGMSQNLNDAPQGTGLIKFDDTIVAFDNTLPKESGLYQLFNTNFHELRESY